MRHLWAKVEDTRALSAAPWSLARGRFAFPGLTVLRKATPGMEWLCTLTLQGSVLMNSVSDVVAHVDPALSMAWPELSTGQRHCPTARVVGEACADHQGRATSGSSLRWEGGMGRSLDFTLEGWETAAGI